MNKKTNLWVAMLLALGSGNSIAGSTTLISKNASNIVGNNNSKYASLSTGGTAVAFQSDAMNFVAQDGNTSTDVYLAVGKKLALVSVNSLGEEAKYGTSWSTDRSNADSTLPSMDASGKFVVFQSTANNLDTIAGSATDSARSSLTRDNDIFLRDIGKKKTYRLSGILAGASDATLKDDAAWLVVAPAANNGSYNPAISNDGKVVVFESEATNLVSGPTYAANTKRIYAIDLKTKKIELVSAVHDTVVGSPTYGTATALPQSAGATDVQATNPAISPDGRFVTYTSAAVNLDSGVTSGGTTTDIFIYDRKTFKTHQLSGAVSSVTATGYAVTTEGNGSSDASSISGSSKQYFIAFHSTADNLDSLAESSTADEDVFVLSFGPVNASDANSDYEIKNPNSYKTVASPSPQQLHPVKRISAILDAFGDYIVGGEASTSDVAATTSSINPAISAKGSDYVVTFETDAANLLSTNDAVKAPAALTSNQAYWQEDSNRKTDIYVYASKKKLFSRANVDPEGIQATSQGAANAAISPDGKAIGFESKDPYLTWDFNTGGFLQIFLRKQ